MNARNPSSGAYGLAQFIQGPSEYYKYGGNPNTAVGQLTAMMNYIAKTYENPNNAWAHEIAYNWYAKGGLIPGMAGGGVAGLRAALTAEQKNERAKYFGLTHAFATGPGKYLTTLTRQELRTLANRQASEQAAYAALAGAGLTTSRMHHLGATARAEKIVAADQALNRTPGGHPGWASDLRKYLGQISATASGTVPAGSTSGGGKLNLPTGKALKFWLGAAQYGELIKYRGLVASFMHGPAKYLTKTVRGELGTLSRRQASEAAAYKSVISGAMTGAELRHLGATARSEYSTAKDQALSKMPGGHPLWAKDLRTYLAQISRLTGTLIPGSGVGPGGGGTGGGKGGGPSLPAVKHVYGGDVGDRIAETLYNALVPLGAARGGVVMDRGGWLQPGWNPPIYNGTGRPERVTPGGAGVNVTFEVASSGTEFDRFMVAWMAKNVKVRGGGDVQSAFGQSNIRFVRR
jgi:hypothetical protein